ncbi:hypothetical protein SNEBB_008505 [Seison nebaliae]|nr:hypothetical protein SNEBB_008505 [Seison nebaliae]
MARLICFVSGHAPDDCVICYIQTIVDEIFENFYFQVCVHLSHFVLIILSSLRSLLMIIPRMFNSLVVLTLVPFMLIVSGSPLTIMICVFSWLTWIPFFSKCHYCYVVRVRQEIK